MATPQPPMPDALLPYVTACFGYRTDGVREYEHVGLPSPTLVVVVDLADGLRISGLGHDRPARFGVSAAGLHAEPVRIHEGGTSHGVMVHLTPLGARAVLGMPAGELAGQVVELEDALGPSAARIREQMQHAGDWDCLYVLHSWLLRRLRDQRSESVGLEAWDCIMAGAAHRVSSLAEATGWSERHLHQQLRQEIGLPPRTLLSLRRFDGTVDDVRRGRSLADTAASHGYADQAHLSREWRRFTGLSPTAWRRHEQI